MGENVQEIECPFCRSSAVYNDEHGSFTCTACGSVSFPPEEDDRLTISSSWKDEQRYKKSISKRGGGTRIKRNKKPPKKSEKGFPWLCDT